MDDDDNIQARSRLPDDDEQEDTIDGPDDDVEEEEIYLAVPTKAKEPTSLDKFYASIGGGEYGLPLPPCVKCNETESCCEVVSVSAPFGDLTERILSLIQCKKCQTWQVRRRQQRGDTNQQGKVSPKIEESKVAPLWTTEDTEEGAAPTDEDLEALFNKVKVTSSTDLKNNNTKKKQQPTSKKRAALLPTRLMLLSFVLEPSEEDLSHEKALLDKYNREARECGEETFAAANSLSRKTAGRMDDFFERIALEPRQRMRYCYGGSPLWPIKQTVPNHFGKCEHCGSERKFEFQITPQAVAEVQKVLEDEEVEFSTIVVFSCESSCDQGTIEQCVVCPAI